MFLVWAFWNMESFGSVLICAFFTPLIKRNSQKNSVGTTKKSVFGIHLLFQSIGVHTICYLRSKNDDYIAISKGV